ncbi:hypothetical protein AWC16_22435 [Mycolicibacter longobardus]|uniref:Uncharacterized protein n=2 Tax=Mycolicibacter longobardus TaxID=1108812 RepID=A0A1X1Y7A5_9MYCO|nr:hypothetical protein AWC16_22435 [Mycolicibacter longobardus]
MRGYLVRLHHMSEQEIQRRVRQQRADIDSLYMLVEQVGGKVDALDTKLSGRIDTLESRFDGLEARFDGLEARFDGLEVRFDGLVAQMDRRFDGLGAQLSDVLRRLA